MNMKFPECYKDILSSFWCFDNWTGRDAKIIDKCEFGSGELIDIVTFDIGIDDSTRYWYGTG